MLRPLTPVLFLVAIGCDGGEPKAADSRPPLGTFDWQPATPESQGMSTARLDAMRNVLAQRNTRALLVIRNDRIVYEWYAKSNSAATLQGTASLAKALVGGVSLALTLADSRIGLDDLVSRYVPAWKTAGSRASIKVRHLATHTSGLEDSSPHDEPGWKADFWKRLSPPDDPFTISRDRTPMLFPPGGDFHYSNPGMAMLSHALTAARKGSTHPDLRGLLRDRVMRPIGVADSAWSVGYDRTFSVDGLPLVACWGGGKYTPRATASVGRLLLREGDWEGKTLIPAWAVREVTRYVAGTPIGSGEPAHAPGFWSNANGRLSLPEDTFAGLGAGLQVLLVVPSLKLIVVRNGEDPSSPDQANHDLEDYLARPLMDALGG